MAPTGHYRFRRSFGNVGSRFRGARPDTYPLFSGILDDYSGASIAFGTTALSSDWLGLDVVLVRRSGDNAEEGFNETELTDGTLESWVSAGGGTEDGFVKTFYGQDGSNNDATQATTTKQPKIVDAGSVIVAKPTIDLYGICGQSNAGGLTPTSSAGTRFDAVSALDYTAKIYIRDDDSIARFNFGGNQNKTHEGQGNTKFGPESELLRLTASASNYVCVVKYAKSASNLWEQWDPDATTGDMLYNTFVNDYKNCVAKLEESGFIVRHKGILYGQGEADAGGALGGGAENYYETKQQRLIDKMRLDLGKPNLPFALTTISSGATVTYPDEAVVNTAKTNVANGDANVTLIDSSSYTFEADDIHYDATSQYAQGASFSTIANGTQETGTQFAAVEFDGIDDQNDFTALAASDMHVSIVTCFNTITSQKRILGDAADSTQDAIGTGNATTGFFRASGGTAGSPALNTTLEPTKMTLLSLDRASNDAYFYTNGTQGAMFTRTEVFGADSIAGQTNPTDSKIVQMVGWEQDLSASATDIQDKINDTYKIYP